jgi:hypothetical protein
MGALVQAIERSLRRAVCARPFRCSLTWSGPSMAE